MGPRGAGEGEQAEEAITGELKQRVGKAAGVEGGKLLRGKEK